MLFTEFDRVKPFNANIRPFILKILSANISVVEDFCRYALLQGCQFPNMLLHKTTYPKLLRNAPYTYQITQRKPLEKENTTQKDKHITQAFHFISSSLK
jgi:hypothetical protein